MKENGTVNKGPVNKEEKTEELTACHVVKWALSWMTLLEKMMTEPTKIVGNPSAIMMS